MVHLQQVWDSTRTKPIIALIGGAGPDAAVDMQKKLLRAMKTKLNISCDQDHYRIIVDNNTNLPNRDQALLLGGPSPLLAYIDSAKKLEAIGGDILIISCNAAHAYFDDIQQETTMRMINMIEETTSLMHHTYNKIKKVGLLSTTATLQTGLYHKAFARYNIEVVSPDKKYQNNIAQAVYGIKAGFIDGTQSLNSSSRNKLYNIYKNVSEIKTPKDVQLPRDLLYGAVKDFLQREIEAVVLGCTEIPLVLKHVHGCVLIDPTEATANAAVDYAINIENTVSKTPKIVSK